jgi:hypothetical protein
MYTFMFAYTDQGSADKQHGQIHCSGFHGGAEGEENGACEGNGKMSELVREYSSKERCRGARQEQ